MQNRRRLILATPALLLAAMACTGVVETRQARGAGRAPLRRLTVRIDTDLIGAAFAAYQGSVPFASRTADWSGFVAHFLDTCRAELRASGIDGMVETISPRTHKVGLAQTDAVLIFRASAWVTRKEAVTGRDHGWSGASTWEAVLVERSVGETFKRSWAATIASENLNPALCGNYSACSPALARRFFEQLRQDGIIA